MGTGLSVNNPTIVTAFHRALLHQGLVVAALLVVVAIAWSVLRSVQIRKALTSSPIPNQQFYPEPVARRLLRISFGLIWIFDGVLQGQASMPLGMAPDVIKPAAAASPSWVQHLDNAMATVWSYHPIAAPASAVWIQIGIGLWLLVAPRGNWSRLAGVASAGWSLVVWVFGEAFGQIFAPGLTWLFGAPGAVLFYCVAGALVALPEGMWRSPRLGRVILGSMGLFFVGMAVLQAWPGRGFWQGQAKPQATPGTLTSMVQQMAQTPQPHLLSSWVTAFYGFDLAHGWAVNLFAVVALAAIGVTFLTGDRRIVRSGVIAGVLLCLADWVLIEDLGFLGGVGTDPNSMIPMSLIFIAGYLAIARIPPTTSTEPLQTNEGSVLDRLRDQPLYTFRSIAALTAIGVTLVGAAPMAVSAGNPNADPILAKALNGPPQPEDFPAPTFDLVNQFGQPVSLSSLRGKTIALTFLDDVCTSTCPTIASELRATDDLLGSDVQKVDLVAVDANPRFITPDYLLAFDEEEGMNKVRNWIYLTSPSLPVLQQTWRAYGVEVAYLPAGAMIDHSEIAEVIDPRGHVRYLINTDPGPETEATESSFSVTLADLIKSVVAAS